MALIKSYITGEMIMDKSFDPTERVSINTHSSIRIAGSKVLYFDPFEIAGEPHDADMIFITHDHYDHFSPDDIRKVKKDATLLIVPEGMKKTVLDKTEFFAKNIIYMKSRQQKEFSRLLVETVPAYNRLKPFHSKGKGWVGYVVTLDDVKYYIAGDTDVTKEAMNVRCNVAIVPVGGHYTMDARDAAKLVKEIHPRYAIPSHYGKIVGTPEDGQSFAKLLPRDIKGVIKIALTSILLSSLLLIGCGEQETPAPAAQPVVTAETAASEEITEAGGDASSKEDAMLTAFSKKELIEQFGKVDTDSLPQAYYVGMYDDKDYIAKPSMEEPLTGITFSRLLDLDRDGQNELLAFYLQKGHLQYLVFEATEDGVLGTAIGDSHMEDICGNDFMQISVTAAASDSGMTIEEAGFRKNMIFNDYVSYYSRQMHYDGKGWTVDSDSEQEDAPSPDADTPSGAIGLFYLQGENAAVYGSPEYLATFTDSRDPGALGYVEYTFAPGLTAFKERNCVTGYSTETIEETVTAADGKDVAFSFEKVILKGENENKIAALNGRIEKLEQNFKAHVEEAKVLAKKMDADELGGEQVTPYSVYYDGDGNVSIAYHFVETGNNLTIGSWAMINTNLQQASGQKLFDLVDGGWQYIQDAIKDNISGDIDGSLAENAIEGSYDYKFFYDEEHVYVCFDSYELDGSANESVVELVRKPKTDQDPKQLLNQD